MIPHVSDERLSDARRLRKGTTAAETMLWRSLRDRGIATEVRRQVPVGPYLAEHGWRVLRVPDDIVIGGGDIVLGRIEAALAPQIPSSDPR